jgi:prepilin-type N-terminal cleavage/methylation domain-containing protein
MQRLRARVTRARVRAGQEGWTLVELLISVSILSVVMAAVLALLDTTWSHQPADQEWNHQIEDTRTGVYRMTRDLRQGTSISLLSAYRMSADVRLNGVTTHVLYQCDLGGVCTRKTSTGASPSAGAGGDVIANHVLNATNGVPVFTQPSPGYFKVAVQASATGSYTTNASHTLTYTDGFYARNN